MFKLKLDEHIYTALFQPEDAIELYELIAENRHSLGEWLSFPGKTKSLEDTERFIERSLDRFSAGNGFWAGIWFNGQLAGAVGYLHVDKSNRKTEIGYWLGESFQGYGLVTKSCQRFIDHAFKVWELNKVEINMASRNTRSRSVAERLGFMEEGTIREFEYINGEFKDRVIYGMIRREWEGQRKEVVL
ncbi:GNAT family N-acetyltransferase [Rossellomorea vietnamensis]|uniref:GNAT family N-acetyltransferase n=1 Tax=Rossellomorea vietnamensis TaxID=218284 RepID=A0A5D4K9D2_9BACI|nr:GNAT family protein [Rossellomorea vietnamensis]TYR73991.1 GNAT family N-acetyltransferase [Rossellomorea vietnamensis]